MSDAVEIIPTEDVPKSDDSEQKNAKIPEDVEKAVKDNTETEKSAVEATISTTTVTSSASTPSVASEESAADASPLEQKIIRQVEYYFGDANLARDKFLIEEIKKDEGWVTLKTLLTFNRLKALSEDPTVIIAALKKSTNDLLELKSDGTAIRRHPTRPLPAGDNKQETQARLLYVKGFPIELTLDDLIEYFDQYGGESVSLRHDAKRKFKGSVFILFKSAEQAKEYLETPEMKYKDTVLVERLYKNDYYKRKQEEKLGGKQEEIKKKEEQKKKKEQEEKEELQSKITRGALLKVTGIEVGTTVDKIKEFFGEFGKIAWVDFEKGEGYAIVRYAAENAAKEAWDKAVEAAQDGKVQLNDKELTAVIVEGEEEESHWKKVFESINNRFKGGNRKFNRGGAHRGGQRGGHRDRGHKRRNTGADSSEISEKKLKADDG